MESVMRISYLSLLSLCLLTGCGSSTKSVMVDVQQPAELYLEGMGIENIVIGEIRGGGEPSEGGFAKLKSYIASIGEESKKAGSEKFSRELYQALLELGKFKIMKQREVLGDLKKKNSVYLTGEILTYEFDSDLETDTTEHKNKKTRKVTTTEHHTRTSKAEVVINIQLQNWSTSETIMDRNFTGYDRIVKSTVDKKPEYIGAEALLKDCRADIVTKFVRAIAPYSIPARVSFLIDKKIPELERSYTYAELGEWENAISLLEKVIVTYKGYNEVHKAHYNLGLSYTYTDQYEKARKALDTAYRLKNDERYLEAMKDVDTHAIKQQRLTEQRKTKTVVRSLTVPIEKGGLGTDQIVLNAIKGRPEGNLAAIRDVFRGVSGESKKEGGEKFTQELKRALVKWGRYRVRENVVSPNSVQLSGDIPLYEFTSDLKYSDRGIKNEETNTTVVVRSYMRSAVAKVSIALQLKNTTTSEIIMNKTFSEEENERRIRIENRPERILAGPLFQKCRARIISAFLKEIKPDTVKFKVHSIVAEEIPELDQGFRLAELRDWSGAIELLNKTSARYPDSPLLHKIHYNLGQYHMHLEQFQEARAAFNMAYQLKEESLYLEAIEELDSRTESATR